MKTVDRLWGHLLALCLATGFVGFVAGAAFTDSQSSVRDWISALSGWFAGLTAIWIGVTQLKPLIFDMKLKQHEFTKQRALQWRDAFDELNREGMEALVSSTPYTINDPILLLLSENITRVPEASTDVHEKMLTTIDVFHEYSKTMASLSPQSDTPHSFSVARSEANVASTKVREAILDFSDMINVEAYEIELRERKVDAFCNLFRTEDAKRAIEKIVRERDEFAQKHEKFLHELSAEVFRLEQLIHKIED